MEASLGTIEVPWIPRQEDALTETTLVPLYTSVSFQIMRSMNGAATSIT